MPSLLAAKLRMSLPPSFVLAATTAKFREFLPKTVPVPDLPIRGKNQNLTGWTGCAKNQYFVIL